MLACNPVLLWLGCGALDAIGAIIILMDMKGAKIPLGHEGAVKPAETDYFNFAGNASPAVHRLFARRE
jgi:hypothetical protein